MEFFDAALWTGAAGVCAEDWDAAARREQGRLPDPALSHEGHMRDHKDSVTSSSAGLPSAGVILVLPTDLKLFSESEVGTVWGLRAGVWLVVAESGEEIPVIS